MPAADKNIRSSYQRGFTLIESVLGIVVFGFAMILLGTTVFPLLSQSPTAHFEARATALGQAVMNKVIAAQFDANNPGNGSLWRCGENTQALAKLGIRAPDPVPACANSSKASNDTLLVSLEDYIGCWGESEKDCPSPETIPYRGKLPLLLGNWLGATGPLDFSHFVVNIDVINEAAASVSGKIQQSESYKRVDVAVITPKHGRYAFTSYRSNY